MKHFSPFGKSSWFIWGLLDLALEGKERPIGIHATTRGLRLTIAGKTFARGRGPDELQASFNAELQKLKDRVRAKYL